ncbi:MAG TPA: tetratricopeptide repeat protein [Terriglobales bacterium]|nr:tetratricopeptide repeat protein [Terriglobales bacterium]
MLVLVWLLGGVWFVAEASQIPTAGSATPADNVVPGSEACASCHTEIYESYSKTAMATASGPAIDGFMGGGFTNKTSGVTYRVYERDAGSRVALGPSGSETRTRTIPNQPLRTATVPKRAVWMSYERAGEKGFGGERELLYFIGSGVKGRTYLFSVDGFWFEAPIIWYSQEGKWNMTPAYSEAREMPMNLPAYPSCLNCHSSGMRAPVAGTDSQFLGEPFAHGGITCERCHGFGAGHVEGKGAGVASSIVNPAKLPAERRDGICMECHFEGAAAVQQPGKHLYDFQPGDRLSDYEHYSLLSGNQPEKPQGLSQFEALSLSECKRKSGERMWCGSCHDPHQEPSAAEKVSYYRGKCLACHGEAFAAKHHADKPNCVACHMPELPTKDVAHTETTDHRIMRYPNIPPLPRLEVRGTPGAPLVAFPASDAALSTTRDFALAWESLALRGVEDAPALAEEYLQKAVKERPDDPAVLSALGFVEQEHKNENAARELYQRALKIDPLDNQAAANLGMIEARAGNLRQAAELWQGAFSRVPHRSAIGMDLAILFCSANQKEDARRYVERVLEFNPDDAKAKSLLAHLNENPVQCRP